MIRIFFKAHRKRGVLTVHTRYEYEDGRLIGIAIRLDGGPPVSLPAETAPEPPERPIEPLPAPEALPAPLEAIAAPTADFGGRGDYPLTERVGMGAIRGCWTEVLGLGATGVTYLANNTMELGLPTTAVVVIGISGAAVGYAVKRGVIPDSTL